ncbi:MAG: SAM-dependent methyltransferase, partial [Verrucomicrobia bacterium]
RKLTADRLQDEDALLQFVRQRVRDAIAYRQWLLKEKESNAARMIFSEADGLPGLIVDRYNDILSLHAQTQAMDRAEIKQAIVAELQAQLVPDGVAHIVERVEPHIRELEQLPPAENHLLWGEKTSTQYELNGMRFHYNALSGQKSGAFLDQRENYAAAERYAHGTALDVFCYQGGFALHLTRVCSAVTALDSSRPALEVAEENEKLNQGLGRPQIEWIEANAFDFLKDYSASGQQYDTIVLDPPAFAKSKRNLETALRGYKELNLRAMKMLRPAGVLVACSCSYHVSDEDFRQMLTAAAVDAGRTLRLLEIRTQSKDHPIVLGIPESHYLKCMIASAR